MSVCLYGTGMEKTAEALQGGRGVFFNWKHLNHFRTPRKAGCHALADIFLYIAVFAKGCVHRGTRSNGVVAALEPCVFSWRFEYFQELP